MSRAQLLEVYQNTYFAKYPQHAGLRERGELGFIERAVAEICVLIEAKDADGLIARNLGGADMNPASRALFTAATGVALPRGRAATEAAIDAWAGVTPEQRAQRTAARRQAAERKSLASDVEWARKPAALIEVRLPQGGTTTGDAWVDSIIEAGFGQLVQRGPRTFLARDDGQAYVMPHKDIAAYARAKDKLAAMDADIAAVQASSQAIPAPGAVAPEVEPQDREPPHLPRQLVDMRACEVPEGVLSFDQVVDSVSRPERMRG